MQELQPDGLVLVAVVDAVQTGAVLTGEQGALAGDFAPRAHVTLREKDTCLAMDMAGSVGFDAAMGALARDVFAQASAQGLAQEDDAALLKWMRRHR